VGEWVKEYIDIGMLLRTCNSKKNSWSHCAFDDSSPELFTKEKVHGLREHLQCYLVALKMQSKPHARKEVVQQSLKNEELLGYYMI